MYGGYIVSNVSAMNIKWSYCAVAFIFCFKLCLCQRRIVKGSRTYALKRYMVYLIQSHDVTVPDNSWLCGGALVSASQILTSAACIVEMENVYAIAGYLSYVNGMDIDQDNCTKFTKRKIIKIRVPRKQLEDFSNSTQWMSIDVGIATVETPYDFEDISFRIYCSYIPAPIQINYSQLADRVGTNVVALGWGRDRGIRPNDITDRNAKSLQEVSLKIKSKEHCKKNFIGDNVSDIIDKYMICVHGKGVLDAEGLVLEDNLRHGNKCVEFRDDDKKSASFDECLGEDDSFTFRRQLNDTSGVLSSNQSDVGVPLNNSFRDTKELYRRQGICQNDHGGPLITWIGAVEIVIGVAVNSLYDSNYECVGPYLFTSTSAVGSIIKCLLMSKDFTRSMCSSSTELMGYKIVDRSVFWNNKELPEKPLNLEATRSESKEGLVFKIGTMVMKVSACSCQRRITHGRFSPQGKRFMVYLLNSRYSDVQPDSWLCGGSLVSEKRILTSAACLTEVTYIYAIAGYKKYVSGVDIDKDECTRTRKQKVVEFIIPTGFKKHGSVNPDVWMRVDVGIAVVEKPYDFSDKSYRLVCSYEPAKILINYDRKYEEPNTVAVVYGWGGTKARKPGEKDDINSKFLREARTVVTNTTFCANYVSKDLTPIVNQSLICAFGSGYLSTGEKERILGDLLGDDCKWRRFTLNESVECNEDDDLFFRNRQVIHSISQEIVPGTKVDNLDKNNDAGGICENDHGGPLVTWIGKSEVVIGIALTSIYSTQYECQGPYLYVGTARSGSLIQCLLAQNNETRALCNHLNKNVQTVRVHWPKTKEETKKTLKPRRRHQMPITHYKHTTSTQSNNRVKMRPQRDMSIERYF